MARIMDYAPDQTAGNFSTRVHGQLISSHSLQSRVQVIVQEYAVEVTAASPHVIYPVPITSEGTVSHDRTRIPKDRQDAAIDERPLARLLRYHVVSGIGNVTHEQAIVNHGGAPSQEVDRRSRHLRSVPEKYTVLNQHRLLIETLVLNGDSGAARAGKVVHDFNLVDSWIGKIG